MRLAIVGSTCLEGNEAVRELIVRIIEEHRKVARGEFVIVSGGALGVDKMAEAVAKGYSVPTVIFYPGVAEWDGSGAVGFKARNLRIARYCTDLIRIACIYTESYSSRWTCDRARELSRPCREYRIDGTYIEEAV